MVWSMLFYFSKKHSWKSPFKNWNNYVRSPLIGKEFWDMPTLGYAWIELWDVILSIFHISSATNQYSNWECVKEIAN